MSDGNKVNKTSLPKAKQPYTARGRELDQSFFKGKQTQATPTLEGRNRSNSLRRLQVPVLENLVQTSNNELVKQAADRELKVRQELVTLSQQQHQHNPPKMASKGPITMEEVSALRFASSLAEEAQDELHKERDQKEKKEKSGETRKKDRLGQIGIANVGGTLGMGFSGNKEQDPFMQDVQKRMLKLQVHYQKGSATDDWSNVLTPVRTPKVTGAKKVCAASRANAAARSANGEFQQIDNISRKDLMTADTLVEMTSRATHPAGGRLAKFEAQKLDEGDYVKGYKKRTMATRNRNGSVSNMTNSCQDCMDERLNNAKFEDQ